MTTAVKKSAAEARKSIKTSVLDTKIKILPNISLEKGDWVRAKLVATRIVPNEGDPFNVHDVIYLEGSLDFATTGKDKTQQPLTANMEVSMKGNARLDRGFAQLQPGQTAMIEYLGKVDAGHGREANEYVFELVS